MESDRKRDIWGHLKAAAAAAAALGDAFDMRQCAGAYLAHNSPRCHSVLARTDGWMGGSADS